MWPFIAGFYPSSSRKLSSISWALNFAYLMWKPTTVWPPLGELLLFNHSDSSLIRYLFLQLTSLSRLLLSFHWRLVCMAYAKYVNIFRAEVLPCDDFFFGPHRCTIRKLEKTKPCHIQMPSQYFTYSLVSKLLDLRNEHRLRKTRKRCWELEGTWGSYTPRLKKFIYYVSLSQ
jgi:hypothetical protein